MGLKESLHLLKMNYRLIGRLFRFSKSFRKGYIAALLINAFTMVRFSFVIGFSVQWVTDSAIARDWKDLNHALIFVGCAFAINSVLYYFESYLMQTRVEMIIGRVKQELMDKVLSLPAKYHNDHHSAELQSKLTSDLNSVNQAISFSLVDPVNFMTLGVVNMILILLISWQMALFCISLILLVLLINAFFLKPVYESSDNIQKAISAATERFSDMIRAVPVVKMFHLEKWTYDRYDNESKSILFWQNKLNRISSGQRSLNKFIDTFCTVGVLGAGALFLSKGFLTAGGLLAVFRYASQLVKAFTGFGWVLSNLTQSLVGAKRLFEVLDLDIGEELPAPGLSAACGNTEAALQLSRVSYGHEPGRWIIRDVSETIRTGETVALVGPSGAGKSTLLNLIMGFYDLPKEQGCIAMFGSQMRQMTPIEWRSRMAYVPQSTFLFSGTVQENIAYGKENALEDEIIEAAKAAYAHNFIMELPQGYDTLLGEQGHLLSGGEKQRVAIARALLRNAPILLLDEPTSALDSASEQEVQQALERLKKGRTVIVAAHRLSTVVDADRILYLESGTITESGNHDELMKLNKQYAGNFKLLYQS